jgi:hypothetical protein
MKQLTILIIVLFFSLSLNAQISLNTSFNKSHIGKNLRLGVNYDFKRASLNFGINYLLQNPVKDNQGYLFKNRFNPNNFGESLGFYFSPQFNLLKNKKCFQPFIYYDFSFKKSSVIVDGFFYKITAYDTINNRYIDLYEKVKDSLKPIIAVEHHIGIGANFKIIDNLYITQKIGGGIAHFHKIDPKIFNAEKWELAWMFEIGVKYSFNKVIKKKKHE